MIRMQHQFIVRTEKNTSLMLPLNTHQELKPLRRCKTGNAMEDIKYKSAGLNSSPSPWKAGIFVPINDQSLKRNP